MNTYQQEQYAAYDLVVKHLSALDASDKRRLDAMLRDYLVFRGRVDEFLHRHFADTCSQSCYQSRRSACCSRDGILTFFADVVINVLCTPPQDIERIMTTLQRPNTGFKCIYLRSDGCMWQVKPIVCAMFICDSALGSIFEGNPALRREWEALNAEKNRFTWPDKPVLFDDLEAEFIKAKRFSSLMYLHNSPGLLRLKKCWQGSSPPPETPHETVQPTDRSSKSG